MHVSCKSYASPIRIPCEYHATVANASSACMLYASPARVSCKFQDSLSLPHSLSLSLSLSDSLSLPLCESNKLQPLGELHEIVKRSCNTETQVHGRASEAKLLGKKATTPTLNCDRETAFFSWQSHASLCSLSQASPHLMRFRVRPLMAGSRKTRLAARSSAQLQLILDQPSSSVAKSGRVMLSGLEPGLACNTLAPLLVTPLAVSRSGVTPGRALCWPR